MMLHVSIVYSLTLGINIDRQTRHSGPVAVGLIFHSYLRRRAMHQKRIFQSPTETEGRYITCSINYGQFQCSRQICVEALIRVNKTKYS